MDAVKFLKEKKRMCDLHTHAIGCDFCPLSMHNNETGERCRHYIFNNPEEAVSVVENGRQSIRLRRDSQSFEDVSKR